MNLILSTLKTILLTMKQNIPKEGNARRNFQSYLYELEPNNFNNGFPERGEKKKDTIFRNHGNQEVEEPIMI